MKHKIEVKDIENNVYYKMNPEYFDEIIKIIESRSHYGQYMQFHRKELYDFVLNCTWFLGVQKNIRFSSRLRCIIDSIVSIPLCQTCNVNHVDMRNVRLYGKLPRFCSTRCSVSNSETQHKICSTMKANYGVEHALQNKEICERATKHRHETNLEKYGVEEVLSLKSVQEKKEATNLDRYGVKCTLQTIESKEKSRKKCIEKYGVDHHMKNKDIYAKSRQTCKENYGDEYPIRTQPVKEKLKSTNRNLYGVDWTFQSDNNKQKTKKKCQEKYGTDYALQAFEVRQHIKQTLHNNYGVEHNSQIPEVRSQMQKKYKYDNIQFDSSAELCFYIWLTDNNIDFVFQPDIHFEYEFNKKIHQYCPDFQIEDMFFEIKGDHFFKDKDVSKEMICPFDHSQDSLYEAKHQCMLKNDIVIMTSSSYLMFQMYVENKYGKQYWKKFKNE